MATPQPPAEEQADRIRALEAEVASLRQALDQARSGGAGSEGETKFRAIADSIDQMIWSTTPDGHHDYFNRRWYDYTGVPSGSTDGEEWNGVFHPEDQERAWETWRHSLATGEHYQIEYRLRHRSGDYRWVLGRAQPVRGAGGAIERWYGTCTDIHDFKLAEQKLRQSEERLQTALDAGEIGDYEWDLATGEIRWSHNLMTIVGLPTDTAVTGETVFNLIHPDDRDMAEAVVRRAVETGEPIDMAYRVIGGDGVCRWVASRGRVAYDPDGSPRRLVGVNYDVTKIRLAEERLRETEARLRTMTDNLPGVVVYQVVTTRDMSERRYTHVSANAQAVLGVSAEAAMADPAVLMGRIDPANLQAVLAAEQAAAAALETLDVEITGRTPRGELRTRIISRPRELSDGQLCWDGLVIDITERRRQQEEAERTAALLNAVGEATPDMIFAKDRDSRILYANAATCRIVGIAPEQLIGKKARDYAASAAEAAAIDANDRAVIESGTAQIVEEVFTSPGGERRVFRSAKTPMRDAQGEVIGLAGVSTDISERVEAEERLRESEQRFRDLAENMPALCWWADASGYIFWYNRRWYDYTGTTAEQMEGWGWQRVHDPDVLPSVMERWQASIATGQPFEMVFPLRSADGEFRPFLTRIVPLHDEAGKVVRWFGTNVDITSEKRLEEALREESRTLETLNRSGSALAAELDVPRLVQMVTDAGVELTGAQFGAFFHNVVNDAGESLMLYTLSGARPEQFNFGMPRATAIFHPTFMGEGVIRSEDITRDHRYGLSAPHHGMPKGHLPVRSYLAVPVVSRSGEVIGGLFFGHPEPARFTARHEQLITGIAAQAAVAMDNARLFQAAQRELENRVKAEQELRLLNDTLEQRVAEAVEQRARAEEALRQAQKMETLGQLTGGVAHDFNNLLQIVSGNLDLLQRQLPADAPRLRRAAENAMRGAERAAVLTQRLLAFSRRQPLAPKPVDVNQMVANMSELLHRTLGETVAVETELADGLWPVEADPNQLENALLNLAINARDAMAGGGRLTVRTTNEQLGADAAAAAEAAPGDYVAISVSDTGSGMDPDTAARAFEPFFTTKEVGKGTGLGLSMVYGFAKQSGGRLAIASALGEGTTVTIHLPRLLGVQNAPEARAEPEAPAAARGETILVCEDDADVRRFSVEVLGELGYRVLQAEDGPEALAMLAGEENVDLLFTDVVLPSGMTGAALAREAQARRPGLKVLFTTGYARNAIDHQGRLDPGVELITKPFAYAELAARMRQILDETR